MKKFLRKARDFRKTGVGPMGKYALIGEKLSHSFSPEIHGRIFKEMGIEGTYELIEMEKNRLEDGVEKLLASGFDGFNVTIPYKESIIPLLHEISPEAKVIGAVNTVKIESGRLRGFNTDLYGFETMLDLGGLHVTPETRALVIGTGGAAKTAAHWLQQRTKRVWFLSRTSRKSMKKLGTFQVIERKDESVIRNMDLVVNCSPRGMFPHTDEMLIDASILGRVSMAVDLVYNPMRTLFMQEMERKNCYVASGLHMLVAQAIRARKYGME
ncbi:MAG: shikimate dehydrogenase [Peptostreptococcaceae bacterium]|nr:shikimate dehydrogenase [Peptostreptococcaceae bacterium]